MVKCPCGGGRANKACSFGAICKMCCDEKREEGELCKAHFTTAMMKAKQRAGGKGGRPRSKKSKLALKCSVPGNIWKRRKLGKSSFYFDRLKNVSINKDGTYSDKGTIGSADEEPEIEQDTQEIVCSGVRGQFLVDKEVVEDGEIVGDGEIMNDGVNGADKSADILTAPHVVEFRDAESMEGIETHSDINSTELSEENDFLRQQISKLKGKLADSKKKTIRTQKQKYKLKKKLGEMRSTGKVVRRGRPLKPASQLSQRQLKKRKADTEADIVDSFCEAHEAHNYDLPDFELKIDGLTFRIADDFAESGTLVNDEENAWPEVREIPLQKRQLTKEETKRLMKISKDAKKAAKEKENIELLTTNTIIPEINQDSSSSSSTENKSSTTSIDTSTQQSTTNNPSSQIVNGTQIPTTTNQWGTPNQFTNNNGGVFNNGTSMYNNAWNSYGGGGGYNNNFGMNGMNGMGGIFR